MLRYYIIDDDMASRRMLEKVIVEGDLGMVIGDAESGVKAISPVLSLQPDIVLVDLLMPGWMGLKRWSN